MRAIRAAPAWLIDQVNRDLEVDEYPRILRRQATEKRCVCRTVGIGVLSAMAPRDTFNGVGVGRKAGSEAGEAIRWGHSSNFIVGPGRRSCETSASDRRGALLNFSEHATSSGIDLSGFATEPLTEAPTTDSTNGGIPLGTVMERTHPTRASCRGTAQIAGFEKHLRCSATLLLG